MRVEHHERSLLRFSRNTPLEAPRECFLTRLCFNQSWAQTHGAESETNEGNNTDPLGVH